PFPRLSFAEAMNRFGVDKPDVRFAMELADLSETFKASAFKVFASTVASGGVIKAFNATGLADLTQGELKNLEDVAKSLGAKGLAFIKVEGGEWKSPIVKFFTDAEKAALTDRLKIEEGDLVLFGADTWEIVCEVLGRIRLRVSEILKLVTDPAQLNFLWVTDFPLLQFS